MIFKQLRLGTPQPRTDRHRLAGTVTVDGLPAKRLVVVFNRTTFVMLAAKWSDPSTGKWEIKGIQEYPAQQLLVIAVDNTVSYNAEGADYISQVTA